MNKVLWLSPVAVLLEEGELAVRCGAVRRGVAWQLSGAQSPHVPEMPAQGAVDCVLTCVHGCRARVFFM